jgi:DNA-binding MarR family transcriptional regulator
MADAPQTTGLGTLLRHLVEQLDGGVEEVYRQEGLDCRARFTPVILHLERHGPSPIRHIAQTSGLSHSAISQTVAEMLKKGVVVRRPGGDSRERIISFSRKGEELLPRLRQIRSAIWAASDEISSEVGVSLPLVIGRALAALDGASFAQRIARGMAEGVEATGIARSESGGP